MSVKPVIYCANVSEFDLKEGNNYTKQVEEYAKSHGAQTVVICARIEEELVDLGEEGAKEYLNELGVDGKTLLHAYWRTASMDISSKRQKLFLRKH